MINNNFTTRDFYLSGFLLAKGINLEDHQKDRTNLTTFVFSNSQALHELIGMYYAQEALINPVAYANALRNLKSMIHDTQTFNHNNKYVQQLTERR